MSFIKYISNEQHYNEVLSLASKCKESLCIGTADIKDLHVKVGDTQEPFLMIVSELLKSKYPIKDDLYFWFQVGGNLFKLAKVGSS